MRNKGINILLPIVDNAIICILEDRRIGIAVDCDYLCGCTHTDDMLNRTVYSNRDIQIRMQAFITTVLPNMPGRMLAICGL